MAEISFEMLLLCILILVLVFGFLIWQNMNYKMRILEADTARQITRMDNRIDHSVKTQDFFNRTLAGGLSQAMQSISDAKNEQMLYNRLISDSISRHDRSFDLLASHMNRIEERGNSGDGLGEALGGFLQAALPMVGSILTGAPVFPALAAAGAAGAVNAAAARPRRHRHRS